jgi:hypothetical protein
MRHLPLYLDFVHTCSLITGRQVNSYLEKMGRKGRGLNKGTVPEFLWKD